MRECPLPWCAAPWVNIAVHYRLDNLGQQDERPEPRAKLEAFADFIYDKGFWTGQERIDLVTEYLERK